MFPSGYVLDDKAVVDREDSMNSTGVVDIGCKDCTFDQVAKDALVVCSEDNVHGECQTEGVGSSKGVANVESEVVLEQSG